MRILLFILLPAICLAQTPTRTEFNAALARITALETRVKTLEAKKTIVIGGTVTTGSGGVDTLKIPTAAINLRVDSAAKALTGLNSATYTATQTALKKADTAIRKVDSLAKLPSIDLANSLVIKALQQATNGNSLDIEALRTWADRVKQISFQ